MILRLTLLLLMTLLLGGCSSLGYYAQSVGGHLSLMGDTRPIEELLEDPEVDAGLKQKLMRVKKIRAFASDELGLPRNGSYLGYADLQRKAVVWSVVATDEFSIEPQTWCYLFVGCASYRGYFSDQRAHAFADGLKAEGKDVAVEPVPAYSTLGWFDDPLPSTAIEWPEAELAGLIFHELAHQQLYVKDDSSFNESFASTVEQIGVERWFQQQQMDMEYERWQQRAQRHDQFVELLMGVRAQLEVLYRQPVDSVQMRKRKHQVFEQLRSDYQALKQGWGGYAGFDNWFGRELNNARLASLATYEKWVPALMELYRRSGSMPGFLKLSKQLAELPLPQRQSRLRQLAAGHPLSDQAAQ
jgi:predicted aminopeptidase